MKATFKERVFNDFTSLADRRQLDVLTWTIEAVEDKGIILITRESEAAQTTAQKAVKVKADSTYTVDLNCKTFIKAIGGASGLLAFIQRELKDSPCATWPRLIANTAYSKMRAAKA